MDAFSSGCLSLSVAALRFTLIPPDGASGKVERLSSLLQPRKANVCVERCFFVFFFGEGVGGEGVRRGEGGEAGSSCMRASNNKKMACFDC